MRIKKFWLSMLLLLLLPFCPADAQQEPDKQKNPRAWVEWHAEKHAADGRRHYLQWYTIEPKLAPCPNEYMNMPQDERARLWILMDNEYTTRMKPVSLKKFIGFEITGLSPEEEERLKFQVASDLISMYQRVKCQQ